MVMDIEAAAEAAFNRLHELSNRRRSWGNHPDESQGSEYGRNVFREMMKAVEAVGNADAPAEVERTYVTEPLSLGPTGATGATGSAGDTGMTGANDSGPTGPAAA